MAFTGFPFPPSTPLYPRAAVVQSYLEAYCSHFGLEKHIRLNSTVQDVWRDSSSWKVQISCGDILAFNAVIVANGHHRTPRYPDIPGLSNWRATGKASHSAWYRSPNKYAGRAVLVIGGGPSGRDIAEELCTVASMVVHSVSDATPEDSGNLKRRGRVSEFTDDGQIVLEDGNMLQGFDHCILATGYEVSFPFLRCQIVRTGPPPPIPLLQREIYNSSYHVFPLAKHMFPMQADIPPGSLIFLGLPVRVAPFPLAQAQARAAVKVFAQPDSLNLDAEMIYISDRYLTLQARFGRDQLQIAKSWDRLPNGEQFDYRDRLYEFAESDPEKRIVVPQWERDMYARKNDLRALWVELEKSGESDQWLQGVGIGGHQDWVKFTEALLQMSKINR